MTVTEDNFHLLKSTKIINNSSNYIHKAAMSYSFDRNIHSESTWNSGIKIGNPNINSSDVPLL